jgi:Spy/CpxP family protein refolding chaperone
MSSARGIAFAALFASALALCQTSALAQEPGPEAQPPGESNSPGMTHPQAIDDEDLQRFAAATAKIRIVDREYTKKKDGKSGDDLTALSEAEEKDKQAAVGEAGLTVVMYNAISKAIQDDPALAKKTYDYIYKAGAK